jgi:hypothetical protein
MNGAPTYGVAAVDADAAAMTGGIGMVTLVALAVLAGAAAAEPPPMLRELDVRPDRGNVAACAYITGPATGIRRFYNEDLEISFWRGPSPFVFSVAKNDVWDRRYFGDDKRAITIDDVRRVCLEGKIGRQSDLGLPNAPQALYLAYDFPCPKPVGQVLVRCPDLEGAEWRAGEAANDALVARAEKGETRGWLWAWLHRTRNVFVVQGEYAGLSRPLTVELFRHQDTTPQGTSVDAMAHYKGDAGYDYSTDPNNGALPHPEAGADGRFFWVRQRFPAEKTFPQGFEYVMMAALDGPAYATQAQPSVTGAGEPFTVHPITDEQYGRLAGYQQELRIAAQRVNESPSGSLASATLKPPGASFRLYVAVVTTRDADDPLAAAKKALTSALKEGAEALATESGSATDEQVRKWRNSRVMHYNATSCTYADSTPWHGDYHWNEGQFTDTIVAGGADTLDQRLLLFEEMLPALQRNAREVYHCSGLAFSLVHYPIRADRVVYSNVTWEWGLENTALMLQPFWQVFQYTQDREFLRKRAYPMMREGARFYADYVTRGEDGYYHVIPTVSQEHWGFTPGFELNRDSVGALSFIKYHLKACVEASETLGVDAEERAKWREIAEHLAPYPTLDTPEGPVFCDVRDAPRLLNYNITANLVMVLWAEDISMDSDPALLEIARRSYEALPDKEHSMRPGYLNQIRLFLGILDKPYLTPQGRVLSWPGPIHLYAGVPEGASVNDSFAGYLAVGGFEVSAAHAGAEVRGMRIKSIAGKTCRLKNPWPGEMKVVRLPTREPVPHRMEGDTVVFDTQPDTTYRLFGGTELPLAEKRFVKDERVIGRWTFDSETKGVVPDVSGHAHDAKLIGEATLARVSGGGALQLPGGKSYARVERTPDFDFSADQGFAIEARIRLPAAQPPYMVPILCSMDLKQYCFMVSDGRLKLYLSSPTGDVYCSATGKTILTDGQWHTVRGERDVSDGTVCVYVDGKLEGSAPDITTGDFASKAPITIGAYLWGEHSRYAEGLIDSVEVRTTYRAG